MSERELQAAVVELARRLGYAVSHFSAAPVRAGKWVTPVAADSTGFPDLVLVGRGRIVYAELKADRRYPSPAQRAWLERLADCGAEVHVWRPADWHSGAVEAVLAA